jgi:predicted unusual protein kinase regulating ubiquinone biosynthesis (AarF/ABC1/UbiB family)
MGVQELSLLQDRVPAFSPDTVIGILERELGCPINARFRSFERNPIAAASLGQVRCARVLAQYPSTALKKPCPAKA